MIKKKKRVSLVSVLVASALFIGMLTGFSYQVCAVNEVKIGVILPLSGPVAPIGETVRQGLDFGVAQVNSEGGIESLGGAKLKLVYADSTGDPKVGMSEAERLILEEDVVALMGAYQSSVTLTSTQVAQRYKVPYVTVIAVSDAITERGFDYVFRVNETAGMTADVIFDYLNKMGEKTGKPLKTLGFLYENTEWGQSSSKAWHECAKEYGYKVLLDEPYPHGATDLSPVILKFKNANPDGVVNVSYLSDMILIWKTMAAKEWRPKVFISGGGGEIDPDFIPAVGNLSEYQFTVVPWPPDMVKLEPWITGIAEDFEKKYGVELTTNAAEAYGIFYVLVDALERAGSTDSKVIRDALAETHLVKGEGRAKNTKVGRAFILPYKRIEFGPDGQNPYVRIPVCQFQNKRMRTVWPEDLQLPGVKPVWPAPPWGK